MNPSRKAHDPGEQLQRARLIQRSLGFKVAWKYMKLRGWSVESVIYWLLDHPDAPQKRGLPNA